MKVRGLNLADKPVWLGMRRRLRPGEDEAVHERDWRRIVELRADYTALLALADDDSVIGLVEISRRPAGPGSSAGSTCQLAVLHVDQGHPREAVARRLLAAASAWAQARGCRELITEIDTDNHWDQKLSEQLGFEEVARVVRYRRVIATEAPEPGNEAAADTAPRMPPEVAVLPVGPGRPASQGPDPHEADEDDEQDAPEPWRGRAVHGALWVLGLAAFYFTDIWGGDVFTGVVLPFVDVLFVIYVLTMFVMVKYRRKTDAEDRALSLFDAVKDHDTSHQGQ